MVMMNVWIGFTLGITAKTVSPTKPRDVEATPDEFTAKLCSCPPLATMTDYHVQSADALCNEPRADLHLSRTLSAAVTSAHAFGAQYAWLSPRVKGNSLLRS